jgi:NADH-quinone oxidoreductase subunit L
LLLVPIVILAFFAGFIGLTNATPLGEDWEKVKEYVEPRPTPVLIEEYIATGPGESVALVEPQLAPAAEAEGEGGSAGCGFEAPEPGTVCFFPGVRHAEPKFSKILLSLGVVAAAYVVAIAWNIAYYRRRNRHLVGLTERSRVLRGGFLFLKNKYYLDALYENVIVRAIAHPIAKGTNWVNQNVIDGVVNRAGTGSRSTAEWVYRNVDQRVVDGAVNASGTVASETGHALQPVQSGKVSMYGALLFGAATVGAIVLVILTV